MADRDRKAVEVAAAAVEVAAAAVEVAAAAVEVAAEVGSTIGRLFSIRNGKSVSGCGACLITRLASGG